MKYLDNRYVKVLSYKDFDICILKISCPKKGDRIDYAIDDEQFSGHYFSLLNDAVKAIDLQY